MGSAPARKLEIVYEVPADHERWTLEEDDVPESALHDAILLLLVEILLAWRQRTGADAMIGRNIALRWNQARPREGVDPDVYLVEPAPPDAENVASICTWRDGHHAPRVAIEVVSESTAEKDYGDGPDRYAASGTRELWIFDPLLVGPSVRGGPHRIQIWRRDELGAFRRMHAGERPARSEELGAWLVTTDGDRRLRIADDAEGMRLWLTGEEAVSAENARLRAENARLRGR